MTIINSTNSVIFDFFMHTIWRLASKPQDKDFHFFITVLLVIFSTWCNKWFFLYVILIAESKNEVLDNLSALKSALIFISKY